MTEIFTMILPIRPNKKLPVLDNLLVQMEKLSDDEAIVLKVIFIREIKGRNQYVAFHDEFFESLQLLSLAHNY